MKMGIRGQIAQHTRYLERNGVEHDGLPDSVGIAKAALCSIFGQNDRVWFGKRSGGISFCKGESKDVKDGWFCKNKSGFDKRFCPNPDERLRSVLRYTADLLQFGKVLAQKRSKGRRDVSQMQIGCAVGIEKLAREAIEAVTIRVIIVITGLVLHKKQNHDAARHTDSKP